MLENRAAAMMDVTADRFFGQFLIMSPTRYGGACRVMQWGTGSRTCLKEYIQGGQLSHQMSLNVTERSRDDRRIRAS